MNINNTEYRDISRKGETSQFWKYFEQHLGKSWEASFFWSLTCFTEKGKKSVVKSRPVCAGK